MNELPSIEFFGTSYNQRSFVDMSTEDMLSLRNKAAEQIGVTKIKSFKDEKQGALLTWKMLQKWDEEMTNQEGAGGTKKGAAKPKAEPKPREQSNASKPVLVKRLTRDMFRKISFTDSKGKALKEHPGKGYRIGRWPKYKDGMTLLHCMETDGLDHQDIGFYVANGFMRLVEPTDEEYADGRKKWYKKEGREDPEVVKAKDAADRAAAVAKRKAEREAAAAKKKAEAEAKKAEAAKKKAEADAAKKAAVEKKKADAAAVAAKKAEAEKKKAPATKSG